MVSLKILLIIYPKNETVIKVTNSNKSLQSFYKIGIPKNFAKFTRKQVCWILFYDKFEGLQPATLFNKRLLCRCFPENLVNFLVISF